MKIAVISGYLPSMAPLADYTVQVNKREYCRRHGYELLSPNHVLEQYRDPKSHAAGFTWSRLEYLLAVLECGSFDWVWVVGADTLVTNMDTTLESIIAMAETPEAQEAPFPKCPAFEDSMAPLALHHWEAPPNHRWTGQKHLIIAGEAFTSMQADSFLMRASAPSAAYLRDILSHYQEYKHHPWVEQQVMIDYRDKWAAITCMVPQHVLNSYDYARWHTMRERYKLGLDCYGNRGQWQPGDFLIHWPAASLHSRLHMLSHFKPLIQGL